MPISFIFNLYDFTTTIHVIFFVVEIVVVIVVEGFIFFSAPLARDEPWEIGVNFDVNASFSIQWWKKEISPETEIFLVANNVFRRMNCDMAKFH